jgi:predicted Zn-dependent protease
MRNQLPDAERFLRVAVSATNPKRNARVQLAILARLAKVRTDAYLLLSDEIKEYPGNLMARRLLATMYGEEQRWTEQAEILESIAKLQPKEVSAQVAWAQALFNIPDYKASRNIIDTLLPIYPDEPDVLLLHANLLAKEGKREEGYEVFKRADALNTARSQSSGLLAPE